LCKASPGVSLPDAYRVTYHRQYRRGIRKENIKG
jgi:hypothetical protein